MTPRIIRVEPRPDRFGEPGDVPIGTVIVFRGGRVIGLQTIDLGPLDIVGWPALRDLDDDAADDAPAGRGG